MTTWDEIHIVCFANLGFSVAYFQVPWAAKHGALQTMGVEAAYVFGTMLPVISHELFALALSPEFSYLLFLTCR